MNLPLPNPHHHSVKRLSLIQQIKTYQQRINQYQVLQKQIQQLATYTDINSPFRTNTETDSKSSAKDIPLMKKNSSKSIFGRKSIEIKQNQKQISKFQNQKQQKKRNSNMKIKIYQLQKKLSKLNKEHTQKFTEFTSFRRQQESIQGSIKELLRLCSVQNTHTELFHETALKLQVQINEMSKKTQQCKKQYEFNYRHLANYEFQEQRLQDQIQRGQQILINQIERSQQNIEQESQITKSDQQNQQQQNIKEESILNLSDSKISPHQNKSSNVFNLEGNIYHVVDSNSSFFSDVNHQNYQCQLRVTFKDQMNQRQNFMKQSKCDNDFKQQQLQIIHKLRDAVQTLEEYNNQLSHKLFNQNQEIQSLHTLLKHKKVTFSIIEQKLKSYQRFIKRQQSTFTITSRQLQEKRNVLSHKQGQRGQIRGKIGSKTEQVKMIKLINNAIKRDLQNVKEKHGCLKVYKQILMNARKQNQIKL